MICGLFYCATCLVSFAGGPFLAIALASSLTVSWPLVTTWRSCMDVHTISRDVQPKSFWNGAVTINRCICWNRLKIKTGDTQDIPSHVLISTNSLRYPPTLASPFQGVHVVDAVLPIVDSFHSMGVRLQNVVSFNYRINTAPPVERRVKQIWSCCIAAINSVLGANISGP